MLNMPIVEIFKTINSHYIYDGIKCEIVEINKSSYDYLFNVLRNGEKFDELKLPNNELSKLHEAGYLQTSSPIKMIEHPYTKFLPTFLNRKIKSITLQVTQKCNFRCKYCIYSEEINKSQRSHSNNSMSLDTAMKSIDFLSNHSIDLKEVGIGFYGGEPLLEFELIKKIVAYAKEVFIGKQILFSMTTNGSLLNKEIIKFLKENDFNLMISLDGPKDVNDKNRVFSNGSGTFDSVINNIELIAELYPTYANELSISMVMDPSNDFDCFNSIQFDLKDIDINYINAAIVDFDYDDESMLYYSDDFTWKIQYHEFLGFMSYWGRIEDKETSLLTKPSLASNINNFKKFKTASPLLSQDSPSGPCVPGLTRLFADYKGNLFPCERVSESSESMKIGDINNGFDITRANRLLNVSKLSEEICKKCWAFRFCNQCAKKADDGSKILSANKRIEHCLVSKISAYHEVENYIIMNEVHTFYPEQVRNSKQEVFE